MADVVVANNPSPRMLPTLPDISRGTFRAEQERTIAPHRRGNRERRSHIPQLHSQAPPSSRPSAPLQLLRSLAAFRPTWLARGEKF